jgi:hypothetical protein
MFVRPLSVAAIGALAIGVAALFGASGCDQLEDLAHEVIDHAHPGTGGSGGDPQPTPVCASTESCPTGLVCSTELGACDAPPGCGGKTNSNSDFVACPAVCYGTCVSKVHPTPAPGLCQTDSDCRIYSDYCGGCNCRAVGPTAGAAAPCVETAVQCLVDPCAQKTAVCVNGQCSVADAPTR